VIILIETYIDYIIVSYISIGIGCLCTYLSCHWYVTRIEKESAASIDYLQDELYKLRESNHYYKDLSKDTSIL